MTGLAELLGPDPLSSIQKQFVHGAHWTHVSRNLTACVVVTLNDALSDVRPMRNLPRLSLLNFRRDTDALRCTLVLTQSHPTQRSKRIPIKFAEKGVTLGDAYLDLSGPEGPEKLFNKIVKHLEQFRASNGL